MIDINRLWSNIAIAFPILSENFKGAAVELEAITNVNDEFDLLGISECFCEIVWSEIQNVLRLQVAPLFWSHFDSECLLLLSAKDMRVSSPEFLDLQNKICQQFAAAVEDLQTNFCALANVLKRLKAVTQLDLHSICELQSALREVLLGQLPTQFNNVVYAFYYVSFKTYMEMHTKSSSCIDMDTTSKGPLCAGCNQPTDKCCCLSLDELMNRSNKALQQMELLDGIAGQTLTSLVQKCVKQHISVTCHGVFDRSFLKQLENWLDKIVINWLIRIFNHGNLQVLENDLKNLNIIKAFKVKLTYFLYENIAHSIIEQFFSVIIDFPDSIPAIDDLKVCMEKIDMRKHLIKSLTSSIKVRVLHPGVNTMDILTGYIAAIKAIRYLDNSGIILETVTAPIKEYLRKRSDTVRRVVTGLTEEGPTDLTEELAKGETLKENIKSAKCVELINWENWTPDPFGLEQSIRTQPANMNRTADIISMVVDIYGSKELFMNEYRNLMADRLLTQLDFCPDKEIRNLELLKLRFGDTLLHSCEVMLKDVADSKRINVHIANDGKFKDSKLFDISALIISAQFWPSFNKENLELPEEIANEFNKYTRAYEAYKGNRTLNWRTVTGRVDIVIEVGERIIEMTVQPTQAVILYHFQHKDEWTLEDLSQVTKVPPTILRRRIGFWQTHGLISEIYTGVFKLLEEEVKKSHFDDTHISQDAGGDEDIESAMASASDQREEELQVFWSYIVGMLTNLDSLPIERIHQMLKLFASHGIGVEFTQNELKEFLQRKVREHKLMYSGGVYQLYK